MSPKVSVRKTSTTVWLGLLTMASAATMTRAFQMRTFSRTLFIGRRQTACNYPAISTPIAWKNRISSPIGNRPLMSLYMSQTAPSPLSDQEKADLETKIKEKGDAIRTMKDNGISKEDLAPHVAELLELKAQLEPPSADPKKKGDVKKEKNKSNSSSNKKNNEPAEAESDFITPRSENYSKWYNDIIRVCDLAEVSPVRGCMVIKPWGMSIWDQIRNDLDARIKDHGAENAYFPLLIPKSFLSKEAEHVDGFAKECAVVTHHRLTADPSGEKGLIADPEAELEDPLIIRPTSETMIWNMFKKWIVSHR